MKDNMGLGYRMTKKIPRTPKVIRTNRQTTALQKIKRMPMIMTTKTMMMITKKKCHSMNT